MDGFGITESIWNISDAQAVGRARERSRWRLGAERARTGALMALGFVVSESGDSMQEERGDSVIMLADLQAELLAGMWEADELFSEASISFLGVDSWSHILADRWRYDDDILVLEARTITTAVSRVADSQPCFDMRFFRL